MYFFNTTDTIQKVSARLKLKRVVLKTNQPGEWYRLNEKQQTTKLSLISCGNNIEKIKIYEQYIFCFFL